MNILDGGEAGYSHEPEIRALKDVQPVTYAEALPQCDIPSGDYPYGTVARKFETVNSRYIIFQDETIYRDGEKLGTFPNTGKYENELLKPYYECPAMLDYITPDTLLPVEEHADIIIGGEALTPFYPLAVDNALYEIFDQPENIIDANVMPLNAEQIAASRASGVYVLLMVPHCSVVRIDEEDVQYR